MKYTKLSWPHVLVRVPESCTSRLEKGNLSCPSVSIVLHLLHLPSSSAGSGETHLQSVLYPLLWHGGEDIVNVELISGNIEMDLYWWHHVPITMWLNTVCTDHNMQLNIRVTHKAQLFFQPILMLSNELEYSLNKFSLSWVYLKKVPWNTIAKKHFLHLWRNAVRRKVFWFA